MSQPDIVAMYKAADRETQDFIFAAMLRLHLRSILAGQGHMSLAEWLDIVYQTLPAALRAGLIGQLEAALAQARPECLHANTADRTGDLDPDVWGAIFPELGAR
jgi:hypothetical protein